MIKGWGGVYLLLINIDKGCNASHKVVTLIAK